MLDAALVEFATRGYQQASIEDIAARAEVTKGAVYYYFADKHDLATDLETELWARLAGEASAHFDPSAPTLANLKVVFRAFLAALGDEGEARFFLRDCWAAPELEEGGRRQEERGIAIVQALVDRGMAAGELVRLDAETVARVLVAAFSEATLHSLTTGNPDAAAAVVERMVDALGAPERGGA